jgi:hypothetical protein
MAVLRPPHSNSKINAGAIVTAQNCIADYFGNAMGSF